MQIHFITPFDLTGRKNIGGAYNVSIEAIRGEADYICIRDGDTMFLTPDWGVQIKEIIEANPGFDIISCMTNRLAVGHQILPHLFDEANITRHVEMAASLQSQYRTEVFQARVAAGLCLIFKRSVWEKCKFKENSVIFDRVFCADAEARGFKIGIAKGLYIFHLYRWGKPNPRHYKEHLNPFK